MPALNFTVFKEKILNGTKRQTIRTPRKRPIKKGDTLYLFWHQRQKDCELLKVTKCPQTETLSFRDLAFSDKSEDIAKADGFKDVEEMRKWFLKAYSPFPDDKFVIIYWR